MGIKGIAHFEIAAPLGTHWRVGTCEEDDCVYFREGWATRCDEIPGSLGESQAAYIRADKSRRYTETREGPTTVVFRFEAGQKCYRQHRVPLGRPELYLVREEGDGQATVHSGPDAWLDDFNTNQDRLNRYING
ncbi:hypothetical protein DMC63_01270 [Streptomyces sp. WAC 05977]|nr:hypothetical protein DMC63_01270 [Streptomyces sp. WAC 05977]